MGARTVLIEADRMGGDCLNTGCVPSKALLAAAHAAHAARTADRFGVGTPAVEVDYARVHAHVRNVIESIAPNDSQERFEQLGCRVLRVHGHFVDPSTVSAGHTLIRARRFVVATGSRAAIPTIPGLKTVPFLTNETIFDLTDLPSHLIVIGAGPIGCELAQAYRRLGARVTVIDIGAMLPKDDPDAVSVVRRSLLDDGVELLENSGIDAISGAAGSIEVAIRGGTTIEGSHLLIAAGRRQNVEHLGLETADIAYDARGIKVDQRLRTSNRNVFAIGDVAGGLQFTHLAGYHAGIVLRNALLRWPAKVNLHSFPWVTYTAPELAQVGWTEAQARARYADRVRVLRASFAENDRALAEREASGIIKVIARSNGKVLGATIAGPHAGELIQLWTLAIATRTKIGAVAGMIAPYPTLGEIGKKAAGEFFSPLVFGPRVRRLVRWLRILG
jgi:pyruvate/2-oxoglutarate dehydrogenase complex dihydrolipoamide dehydrogenase (E3) component